MRRPKPPSQRKNDREAAHVFRRVTGVVVNSLRINGYTDAMISERIKASIREALEDDREFRKMVTFPGRTEPEEALSTAGLYRVLIAKYDIDRSDQRSQERWFEVVERAVAEAIAGMRGET